MAPIVEHHGAPDRDRLVVGEAASTPVAAYASSWPEATASQATPRVVRHNDFPLVNALDQACSAADALLIATTLQAASVDRNWSVKKMFVWRCPAVTCRIVQVGERSGAAARHPHHR